jgi:hypothetical protein
MNRLYHLIIIGLLLCVPVLLSDEGYLIDSNESIVYYKTADVSQYMDSYFSTDEGSANLQQFVMTVTPEEFAHFVEWLYWCERDHYAPGWAHEVWIKKMGRDAHIRQYHGM